MYTWRRGSRLLFEKTRTAGDAARHAGRACWRRSRRCACRAPPCSSPAIPTARRPRCMHSLKHYKVLHEKNVILTIETADAPRVDPAERVRIEPIGETFSRVRAALRLHGDARTCRRRWPSRASTAGSSTSCRRRSSCRAARSSRPRSSGMPRWQDRLFIVLARSRQRRHRLFPDPDRPGGRGRHPGDDLTLAAVAIGYLRSATSTGYCPWPTAAAVRFGPASQSLQRLTIS